MSKYQVSEFQQATIDGTVSKFFVRHLIPILIIPLIFTCSLLQAKTIESNISPELDGLYKNFQPLPDEKDAGAVVLFNNYRITSQGDGLITSDRHVAVALLDKRSAEEYGEFSIGFDSHYQDIELLFAHIVDADGNIKSVSESAIQIDARNSAASFSDTRNLHFALPAVKEGSFLEYKVRYRDKKSIIPGHWNRRSIFHKAHAVNSTNSYRFDPVRLSSFTVDRPKDVNIGYETILTNIEPKKQAVGDREVITWRLTNLPQVKLEQNMVELYKIIPGIQVSTIPDWKTVDSWAKDIYLQAQSQDTTIKSIVSDILTEKLTKREKVSRIFYYLQNNIRYIAAHVGRGGYVPHSISDVLENRYGDCKDQTMLLIGLLKSAGVQAYPALVGVLPEPRVVEKVPSLNFSHMITYIPDSEGDIWLDTSGDTGMFPGISWTIAGRDAFVINGRGGKLQKVVQSQEVENTANISVVFSYLDDALKADVRIDTAGYFSDRWRGILKYDPNAEQKFKDSLKVLFNRGDVISFNVLSGRSGIEPVSISSEIRFDDIWKNGKKSVGIGGGLTQLTQLFTGFSNLPDPASRQHDYFEGIRYRLTMETSTTAPSGEYNGVFLKSGQSISSDEFIFNQAVNKNNGVSTMTLDFELLDNVIKRDKYKGFYDDVKTALEGSSWEIRYILDENKVKAEKLKQEFDAEVGNVASVLKLARHYLSIGEYKEAENIILRAAEDNPKNGEVVYVKGLVLGFLDKYEESDNAMKKSKELGYDPWVN